MTDRPTAAAGPGWGRAGRTFRPAQERSFVVSCPWAARSQFCVSSVLIVQRYLHVRVYCQGWLGARTWVRVQFSAVYRALEQERDMEAFALFF